MSGSSDYRRGVLDRPLVLRTRRDLQAIESVGAGGPSVVVRDPVAGESFHLTAQEYALLAAMRESTTLRKLQELIETRFAPARVAVSQLQQFIAQIYDQGLLLSADAGQGATLLARSRQRRWRERWSNLVQILSIRVGSFSIGPIIDGLYRLVKWAFSPWALACIGAFVCFAAIKTIGAAPELAAKMPAVGELVRPHMWPAWLAAVAVVKICHELGHALVCRHFGARPKEAGLLLLAGAPAMYCDVSDAWRLPSKWQRMAVSAAGMGVEVVIAAAAALVWQIAPPGLVSTICLSLIVVCTIGTLLVNANPLLRYDGYYLLSDWLEVPNLAERARGLWTAVARRWLLGEKGTADPLLSSGKRRALCIYAALSKVYLTLVIIGALAVFLKLARPYGLEHVVYTLAAIVLAGVVGRPIFGVVKALRNPSLRSRLRWGRAGFSLLAGVAILAAVMAMPISRRVTTPLVALPANSQPVFAETAGELTFALPEGTVVKKGDVIARLANPELELSLVEQAGKVRELEVRAAQLRTLRGAMDAAARALPTAEAELVDAQSQLAERQAMVDQLVIASPTDGCVMAASDHTPDAASEALATWSGSPLDLKNRGAWIEAGSPVAVVATDKKWLAWAAVDEADAPAVAAGQPVRVQVDQAATQTLTGQVTAVSQRSRDNESAFAPKSKKPPQLGEDPYYVVEIELAPDEAVPLLPGARGQAKIEVERSTIGRILKMKFERAMARVL